MSYYADDNGIKRFLRKFKTVIGNATLTTTAQTIIGAINELVTNIGTITTSLGNKADKSWTYHGYAYAGSSVTVPAGYNEVMVVLAGNYNNSYRVIAEGIFVPRMWVEQINNTMVMSLSGYHLSDTDHGYLAVTVTNGGRTFAVRSLTWGNQNLSNKYVMVFYR